jgi:integrase
VPEKIDLNDRKLQAEIKKPLAAAQNRRTIWDISCPGLAVRIGAKGVKGKATFFAVRRRAGEAHPTWSKLGQYPIKTLAEAREAARAALADLAAGKDPKKEAEAKRRAEAEAEREAADNTFAAVVERFNNWYRVTPGKGGGLRRTAPAVAGTIARELTSVWGARPIAEITERDVTRAMQAILSRGSDRPAPGSRRQSGGPYAARSTFAAARLVFRWASRPPQRLISRDPTAEIRPESLHGDPLVRDRILSDDELAVVWAAAVATPYPYGSLVRLLALTGARLGEFAAANWSETDLDKATLTVPAERAKTKVAHVIPLPPAALAIVRDLPQFTGGAFLFSTTGGQRPISGFSKFRAKFNETLAASGATIPAFVIHDVRRSVRTGLSTLGVLPVIAEMVIGHQQQGIARVYDLHRFEAEKREAMQRWEAKLLSIVGPQPEPAPLENVVALQKARRRA